MPSGRLLKRIPVFNVDCLVGWGITNESKQIMGTHPDGTLKYWTGDTHHVHPSYTDGTYDGRYLFVNDKIHGRIARVRLDTMECDKITELPNVQGFHGIFPDKRLSSNPISPRRRYSALTRECRGRVQAVRILAHLCRDLGAQSDRLHHDRSTQVGLHALRRRGIHLPGSPAHVVARHRGRLCIRE
nr:hypothetical protein [Peristeroidobacter agariperforans]